MSINEELYAHNGIKYNIILPKPWASFNNGSDSTVGRNSPLREVCSQQSLIGYFLSLDLRWPLYFIRMHQEATTRRYYGLQSSVLCGSSCSNLLSISSSLTALVKFDSSGFNYGRSQIMTSDLKSAGDEGVRSRD